jgi:hypothetical protein
MDRSCIILKDMNAQLSWSELAETSDLSVYHRICESDKTVVDYVYQ